MSKLGVGIIGCGNISEAYLRLAPLFRDIEMRGVADLNPDAAKARGAEFGVRVHDVDGLLASNDIDIIVNLTIPAAHYNVSTAILNAGKHSYSEKPLCSDVAGRRSVARPGCVERPACRIGAGHVPGRCASAGAANHRRWPDRQDRCRHRACDEPRDGALAPEPRFLLQTRRRAGAGYRPVLRHQPDPVDRPGASRRRAQFQRFADPDYRV